jgi:allophanate hydrolase
LSSTNRFGILAATTMSETEPTAPSLGLDLATLGARYASGDLRPAEVVDVVLARIAARGNDGVWISVMPRDALLSEASRIERRRGAGEPLPLFGVPFAVKDNIDVAGLPTTVACPAFAATASAHAPVVARLIAAGAICVGKTNLDQFATGLVGVRSPYGIPRNPFDPRYIVGGSSSGSAVAVAVGEVSFALGTDTAGSGRVPAAFNNVVGLKPTRGLLSTTGVVPACRSLDCVSVFALTVEDAARVADLAGDFDAADPFSRPAAERTSFQPEPRPPRFRFGVPADGELDFLGDDDAAALTAAAIARLEAMGGTRVEIDFSPFRRAGALLYEGPFVAERLVAAGRILAEHPEALVPPVRAILEGATRIDGRSVFEGQHRLETLRRRAAAVLGEVGFLLLPTTPTIYRIDEVEAEPRKLNTHLGTYTNFVNLLDLAAIAVPAGFRPNGLPAGVTLVGPAGTDARLAGFASELHRATSRRLGATAWSLPTAPAAAPVARADRLRVAVAGAHLAGEPLNHQLTGPGGTFVRAARTAPKYRLYALANVEPPKPGLVRVAADGVAIEIEVWALDAAAFGRFVAAVPSPLAIGKLELDDGEVVSGFLCEPLAIADAADISAFGGWRDYLRYLQRTET